MIHLHMEHQPFIMTMKTHCENGQKAGREVNNIFWSTSSKTYIFKITGKTYQNVNINFQDLKSSNQPLKSLKHTHTSLLPKSNIIPPSFYHWRKQEVYINVLKETKKASKETKKIHCNVKHFSPRDIECADDKTEWVSGFKTTELNHADRTFTNSNYLLWKSLHQQMFYIFRQLVSY